MRTRMLFASLALALFLGQATAAQDPRDPEFFQGVSFESITDMPLTPGNWDGARIGLQRITFKPEAKLDLKGLLGYGYAGPV
jgi:hypothetical protein